MEHHFTKNGLKKQVFIMLLFFFSGIFPIVHASGETNCVLIANAGVPENTLSSIDIKNIYNGKKTTWGNGSKITFVTFKSGDVHTHFIRTYLKKNPDQFKNYWRRMLFTGNGTIPRAFDTDEEVIAFVSTTENTIGYISKAVNANGIKIISITQ